MEAIVWSALGSSGLHAVHTHRQCVKKIQQYDGILRQPGPTIAGRLRKEVEASLVSYLAQEATATSALVQQIKRCLGCAHPLMRGHQVPSGRKVRREHRLSALMAGPAG